MPKCFFQLRQLRRIRRSLDDNAVATLVHAFVASRVDYCGSLFVGTPKKTTDKLQRVLSAAVRLVSNTRKYDRGLTHIRRNALHWLDVTDRVRFRVCVQMFKCLQVVWCHRARLLVYYVPPCIQTPWTPESSLCESRTARRSTRYRRSNRHRATA